jgi:aromatic-L-amino-acid decarboxylase
MIRNHVAWSRKVAERLAAEPGFEIVTPPMLSLFTFRHLAARDGHLDAHNYELLRRINDDGRIYLTQTKVDGKVAIRFQAGQFDMREEDADMAVDVILEIAGNISA